MTVRILTDIQKSVIADMYVHGKVPVTDLARSYKCSPRTIKRALEERGVEPTWKRKPKAQAHPVSLSMNPGFPMYQTQTVLDLKQINLPVWSRVKAYFVTLFQ